MLVNQNQVNQVKRVVWRSNLVSEVSAESGARSVIWLLRRSNVTNEVSADSGAMSVIGCGGRLTGGTKSHVTGKMDCGPKQAFYTDV
eukprot:SAG22_NODE_955_length_6331_cov_21.329108_3_plen_87_part_00